MKRHLVFGVLIFLITAGTLPVWSSGNAEQDPEQQEGVYAIYHQEREHIQILGGQSLNAGNGLERAQTRARFMVASKPATKPKDEPDTIVRKGKKK
jgi:hypothetical protein